MKSTNPIWRQFQKLEENKVSILAFCEHLTAEQRATALSGQWSIIQVVRHIQMAEQGSIGYLKKKAQAGDALVNRRFYPRVLLVLTDWAFRLGRKIKAPAVLANPPVTSWEELKNDWTATRADIQSFMENYPDTWQKKAVYKHPFIGMLNLADAIRFFNVHQNHHIRQVHRILKTLK